MINHNYRWLLRTRPSNQMKIRISSFRIWPDMRIIHNSYLRAASSAREWSGRRARDASGKRIKWFVSPRSFLDFGVIHFYYYVVTRDKLCTGMCRCTLRCTGESVYGRWRWCCVRCGSIACAGFHSQSVGFTVSISRSNQNASPMYLSSADIKIYFLFVALPLTEHTFSPLLLAADTGEFLFYTQMAKTKRQQDKRLHCDSSTSDYTHKSAGTTSAKSHEYHIICIYVMCSPPNSLAGW